MLLPCSSESLVCCVKFKIYRAIILPIVLYGCKTWSLTLGKGHGLMVLENRVLRRIFGPKRDEVRGGWRKLHNEELHNLYSSCINRMIKSEKMRWARHLACVGEMICVYKILTENPEEKRPLGGPGRVLLKWISGKSGLGMWIGFIWLRRGTGGVLL
jgi:hypothetical protein